MTDTSRDKKVEVVYSGLLFRDYSITQGDIAIRNAYLRLQLIPIGVSALLWIAGPIGLALAFPDHLAITVVVSAATGVAAISCFLKLQNTLYLQYHFICRAVAVNRLITHKTQGDELCVLVEHCPPHGSDRYVPLTEFLSGSYRVGKEIRLYRSYLAGSDPNLPAETIYELIATVPTRK